MGDPRRTKNKYQKPMHPWQKERLEEEKVLVQKYGLVNKKEVYKAGSKLKKFKDIAKSLVTKPAAQAEKERKQLFARLKRLNLVQEEALDNVLGLETNQILDRRLQTIVYKKGLARTVKQARQMIVHRHIIVNGKMVSSPSYLVTSEEENNISYYPGSNFNDEMHPERIQEKPAGDKEVKKDKKEDKKEPVKEEKKTEEPKEEKSESPKKEEVKEETEQETPEKKEAEK